MQALDAIRLDRIFKLETKEMMLLKNVGNTKMQQPSNIMAKVLDAEV